MHSVIAATCSCRPGERLSKPFAQPPSLASRHSETRPGLRGSLSCRLLSSHLARDIRNEVPLLVESPHIRCTRQILEAEETNRRVADSVSASPRDDGTSSASISAYYSTCDAHSPSFFGRTFCRFYQYTRPPWQRNLMGLRCVLSTASLNSSPLGCDRLFTAAAMVQA
jgi:hypothetical protein